MNVVIVMVVFMRLKILPLSGVMVRNCDGSGYGGYIKISPLGDVMVSNGDCCNGDDSNYYDGNVENLTTG